MAWLALCCTPVWDAAAATYPWEYGFVNANVDCGAGPARKRVKFVSEVFALCPYERGVDISRVIVEDSRPALESAVRAMCGAHYRISFAFVEWTKPRERAEAAHRRALADPAYSQHQLFRSGESRYYRDCR